MAGTRWLVFPQPPPDLSPTLMQQHRARAEPVRKRLCVAAGRPRQRLPLAHLHAGCRAADGGASHSWRGLCARWRIWGASATQGGANADLVFEEGVRADRRCHPRRLGLLEPSEVWMQQPVPQFGAIYSGPARHRRARSRLKKATCAATAPIQVLSSGLPFLYVPPVSVARGDVRESYCATTAGGATLLGWRCRRRCPKCLRHDNRDGQTCRMRQRAQPHVRAGAGRGRRPRHRLRQRAPCRIPAADTAWPIPAK